MKEIMIAKSIDIDRPVEEVFEFVADYSNDPLWRREVVEMHPERKPPEVGDKVRGIIKLMGKEVETFAVITEYEKNKLIAFEVTRGPVRVRGYRLVSTAGQFVKFTYSLTIRISGLKEIISGPLIKSFAAGIERNLPELKKILEARASLERAAVYAK